MPNNRVVAALSSIGAIAGAVALALAPTGCAAPEPRSLTETSWQLVSLPDSSAVPDPSKFTVEFGADGRALFLLDCNRANGAFTATPGDDGVSGKLQFGPIAATMMLCPQPSLDQQVSVALEKVRQYRFSDDQLQMTLDADGGTLTWRAS